MLVLSHLAVAATLAPGLALRDPAAYYLGAIIPDVRYVAGLPREQTHRPTAEIVAWRDRYPDLHDFITGYLVHCLSDSEDLFVTLGVVERLTGTLPLRLVRGRIAPWMVSVAVEYYYVTQRPPTVSLSGQSNALLDELGVPADAVTHMAGEIGRVLENPTFADGVTALQNLGLLGSGGVQRYVQVAQRINSRPLARRLLGWRLGRILRPYEAGLPGFFARWLPL